MRDGLAKAGNASLPELNGPLSLTRNFSWTLAGNMVYAACQWGMLAVLAKLGTPEMVGQFALGFAVTAPVIMFSNLQLRGVQASDARQEYRFGDYLALRLLSTALALIAILFLSLVSGYPKPLVAVILAVGIAKAFESMSDVFYGLLQQRERMDRVAQSMMIKGPLSLAALGTATYLTGDVCWGAVAVALMWAAVLFLFDIPNGTAVLRSGRRNLCIQREVGAIREAIYPRWSRRTLFRLAWLSLPLGLVMLLTSLNMNIPRYFIEHSLGTEQLGIFAAMAYLMVAGNTVVCALGQSATPRLARHYAKGEIDAFRTLLMKLLGMGALLGGAGILAAVLAGGGLLTLLYSARYAERLDVFVVLMLAAAVSYVSSLLGYAMTAARYFRAQTILFAAVGVTTLVASFSLVPSRGLAGAGAAILISMLIQLAGSILVCIHAILSLRAKAS